MIFKIGRNNFALTVMVPYDCRNNCAFCTAKEMYHRLGTNVEDVKFQMGRTLQGINYPISDVVFTGGSGCGGPVYSSCGGGSLSCG